MMERLAGELCQEILQYLQLQDLKSIRLASKLWAELGKRYLISPVFLSLPHRDDFGRLLQLSQDPSFACSIEKLELQTGEVNEYHARHNTFFVQYMKDPEERDRESRDAWAEYAKLKKQRETLVDRYCNLDLMEETFKNLPNLRIIDINLMHCPFQHPLLKQIWQIPTTKLLSRLSTTQRFADITYAARLLNLDSMTHDCLPFEIWSQRSILQIVSVTFQNLRSLKITMDYPVCPHAVDGNAFPGFFSALHAIPGLETLYLGFTSSARPKFTFADYMGEYIWRNLHTLGLESVNIAQNDVGSFLNRHASTLKRLQLGFYRSLQSSWRVSNITHILELRQGTLRGLLTQIRDQMRLEKLNMKGDIVEEITYQYEGGLYEDDWQLVPDAVKLSASARQAEQFVLGSVEWEDAMMGIRPVT